MTDATQPIESPRLYECLLQIKTDPETNKEKSLVWDTPGICAAITRFDKSCKNLAKLMMLEWPLFSGNPIYPVPAVHQDNPVAEFSQTPMEEFWDKTKPYGALRWMLLDYMVLNASRYEAFYIASQAPKYTYYNPGDDLGYRMCVVAFGAPEMSIAYVKAVIAIMRMYKRKHHDLIAEYGRGVRPSFVSADLAQAELSWKEEAETLKKFGYLVSKNIKIPVTECMKLIHEINECLANKPLS